MDRALLLESASSSVFIKVRLHVIQIATSILRVIDFLFGIRHLATIVRTIFDIFTSSL